VLHCQAAELQSCGGIWEVNIERNTLLRCDETSSRPANFMLAISPKCLIAFGFQAVHRGGAFLDSPKPKHYGPRGFEDGRIYLHLLAIS
jgi:hypothetical protein